MHILFAEGAMKKDDLKYAHNPRYCMILPDAEDADEEVIVSVGQS